MVTREQFDKWLSDNRRSLPGMEYFYAKDTNQDRVEDWDKAKLHVLVCFASTGETRSVSNTFTCLNLLLHAGAAVWEDVFVDNAYMPEAETREAMQKEGIPYLTGNASHLDWSHYDMVILSHAIMPECLSVPHMWHESGIPLTMEERDKANSPLIFYGGAAAGGGFSILGGEIKGHGKGLYDIGNVGAGEVTIPPIVRTLIAFDKDIRTNRVDAIEALMNSEIKDYLIIPNKWEVKINPENNFDVISMTPLDSRTPKKIKVGRLYEPNYYGFYKKIFGVAGGNARSSDVQISSGCSGSCCSFCLPGKTEVQSPDGVKLLENVVPGDKVWDGSKYVEVTNFYDMGVKHTVRLTTKRGYSLEATPCHRIMVFTGEDFVYLPVEELSEGDQVVLSRRGGFGSGNDLSGEECQLLGWLVGDGYYNGRIRFYANVEEAPVVEELLRKANLIYTHSVGDREVQRYDIKQGRGSKLYSRWGLSPYTENGKTKPSVLDNMSEYQIRQFLRGLFSADGTVFKTGSVSFGTKHEWLARYVQKALLKLGIVSKLEFRVSHQKEGNFSFRERDKSLYRVFLVHQSSIVRFAEVVGMFDGLEKSRRLFEQSKEHEAKGTEVVFFTPDYRDRLLYKLGINPSSYRPGQGISRKKLRELTDEKVVQMMESMGLYITTISSIEECGKQHVYDITLDSEEHLFVADGFCVKNCSEGQEAGRWTEKELEQVVSDLKETRKWSAPNTIGAFSFNLNYYKHVFDLFKTEADMFSNLSMINQRMDVIGAAPEYLDLAKKMGLKRISAAIEGVGERIRNHILNKNLTYEQMKAGFRVICQQKLIMCKWGMILTGLEEDSDWEEFEKEIDGLIAIREELGANTALQMNFTPLVYYNTIPIRWMPRNTARSSFYNERNMKPFLEWARSRNIRTKVNGRGPGTYIEQLILDLGFAGTDFLCDVSINEGLLYERHFNDRDKEKVINALGRANIDPTIIFPERPLDYVFSSDMIEFTTETNLALWKEQHKKRDFYNKICLKTPANMSPKCRDCGMCPTPETKKQHLAREIKSTATVSDIMESLSSSRPRSAVKIVVQLANGNEIYSKDMLSHYITSQFFRRDDDLADAFYAVSKNTCSWTSNNGQKGWFGGTFTFDIQFRRTIMASQLAPYVEDINKNLEVCRIVKVYDSSLNLEPSNTDMILYSGVINNLPMSRLKDKLSVFDWNVKVAVKGMGGLETELQAHPELKKNILFVQSGNSIMCTMTLPANMNPYLVLSSIIGKGLEYCYSIALFNILDSGTPVAATCSCGETLTHSHHTGKVASMCQTCLAKRWLYKATQSKVTK